MHDNLPHENVGDELPELGLSAPDRAAPDLGRVRARLLARIASEGAATPVAPRQRRRGAAIWWAAAATIALVGAAVLLRNAEVARDAARAELAASEAEVRQLRDSLVANAATLAALTGPEVQVISLAATGLREPRGRMFWDQLADRWTLVAHDLPTLDQGRTYQLWVITRAGEKVSAGTFEPTRGSALVQATYALARDQLSAIAVTEEPQGGVPQPTGAIVIAGTPG